MPPITKHQGQELLRLYAFTVPPDDDYPIDVVPGLGDNPTIHCIIDRAGDSVRTGADWDLSGARALLSGIDAVSFDPDDTDEHCLCVTTSTRVRYKFEVPPDGLEFLQSFDEVPF